KEAAKLHAEVESGDRPEAPPRGGTTKPSTASEGVSTPKKAVKARSAASTPRGKKLAATGVGGGVGDKVVGGRVSKSPKKKEVKGDAVKEEEGFQDFLNMDVEAVAEGLGLNGNVGYEGSFDMEV
ncbi:MAG: hypothetical protein Q9168_008423, partial [Polycauliona sp. 1 TL-2023]